MEMIPYLSLQPSVCYCLSPSLAQRERENSLRNLVRVELLVRDGRDFIVSDYRKHNLVWTQILDFLITWDFRVQLPLKQESLDQAKGRETSFISL